MSTDSNKVEINPRVLKKLQDAISAEYIYTKKIDGYSKIIFANNFLSFSLPIIVITSLYLVKGNDNLDEIFNWISTISSLILLLLSGYLFINGIPDKKERFIVARRINRRVQKECEENLYSDNSSLTFFFKHINDIDDDDLDKIGRISDKVYRKAYHHTLKKLQDYGATCPDCNQAPAKFKKSLFSKKETCNMCGISSKRV